MRPSVVSEAGLQTRLSSWWEGIPFLTSTVVISCGAIYMVCLLIGYDSFDGVCFSPSKVVSHFEVVEGEGIICTGITIENTTGSLKDKAVALRVSANHAAFYKCSFECYEDTLYPVKGYQFYKESQNTRSPLKFTFTNFLVLSFLLIVLISLIGCMKKCWN